MASLVFNFLVYVIFLVSLVSAYKKLVPPKFQGLPTIEELALSNGYLASHQLVPTEDGYYIWLTRVGNNTGPPVLMQHGLINAGDIWITRKNRSDLAVLLLDKGYDVYLSNFRGNTYSRFHRKYKSSDTRFWDFSFHEHGFYDVSAVVDRILKQTGRDKLFYVGHSLGTTAFFVMASARPEYNKKIQAAIMLSPVAHSPEPAEFSITLLRFAIAHRATIWYTLTGSRVYELMPRTNSIIKVLQETCSYGRPSQDYCLDVLGMAFGENRANIDRKSIASQISFAPAGTSAKNLLHLSQVYKTTDFNFLDYGERENFRRYKSREAPPYPLERISAPVALFWSYNDNLISQKSVERIRSRLKNVIWDKPIPHPKFTHGDVIFGIDAKEMLYNDVIRVIKDYS